MTKDGSPYDGVFLSGKVCLPFKSTQDNEPHIACCCLSYLRNTMQPMIGKIRLPFHMHHENIIHTICLKKTVSEKNAMFPILFEIIQKVDHCDKIIQNYSGKNLIYYMFIKAVYKETENKGSKLFCFLYNTQKRSENYTGKGDSFSCYILTKQVQGRWEAMKSVWLFYNKKADFASAYVFLQSLKKKSIHL